MRPGCRPRAQAARPGYRPFKEAARIGYRPTRPRPRTQHADPAHRQRTACRPRAQQAGHTPRPPTQHADHAHRQCTQHAGSRPRVHGPTAGYGIAWGLLGRWSAENTDGLLGLRTWGAEPHGDPSPCSKHQTT